MKGDAVSNLDRAVTKSREGKILYAGTSDNRWDFGMGNSLIVFGPCWLAAEIMFMKGNRVITGYRLQNIQWLGYCTGVCCGLA